MMDVDERDCEPSPPRSPDSIGSCGVLNRPRRRTDARHSPLFHPRACLSRPPSPDHRSPCYVLAQCADAGRRVQTGTGPPAQPARICLRYRDTVRLATVRPQVMSDLLYAPTPSITAGPEHAAAPTRTSQSSKHASRCPLCPAYAHFVVSHCQSASRRDNVLHEQGAVLRHPTTDRACVTNASQSTFSL